MPRNHRDIPDPQKRLAADSEAWHKVSVTKAFLGITTAEAVARLIDAGYPHIVGVAPLVGGTVAQPGGAEQPQAADEQLIEVSDASIQQPPKTPPARRKPRKNQPSGSENIG